MTERNAENHHGLGGGPARSARAETHKTASNAVNGEIRAQA
jgi:hypothetical protein